MERLDVNNNHNSPVKTYDDMTLDERIDAFMQDARNSAGQASAMMTQAFNQAGPQLLDGKVVSGGPNVALLMASQTVASLANVYMLGAQNCIYLRNYEDRLSGSWLSNLNLDQEIEALESDESEKSILFQEDEENYPSVSEGVSKRSAIFPGPSQESGTTKERESGDVSEKTLFEEA